MKAHIATFAGLGFVLSMMLGCATPPPDEPLPAHPYPRWVEQLESGQTTRDDVRAQFGEPNEVEQGPRGETIWRFVYREIDWPKDDPMRPVVAADGTLRAREPSAFARFGKRLRVVTGWFDRAMYFPPRQQRPPRTRQLPATVHQLEIVFGLDEILRRFRYTPHPGTASVAVVGQ